MVIDTDGPNVFIDDFDDNSYCSDRTPPTLVLQHQSEFYGKEFALFDDGDQPHNLKAVLEARPDR